MRQRWADLAWLHWPVDPADVAPLLPAQVRPDVRDGVTWVGLVPFHMQGVGLVRGPAVPWLGTFPETNVRLYSVGPDGRRGVVFRSLDASRALPVGVARLGFALPYVWSRMSVHGGSADLAAPAEEGAIVEYRTERRGRGAPRSLVRIRVGARVGGDDLDRFLTSRWGLHTRWFGTTAFAPVAHGPWPIHAAELLELDDELVVAAGLPTPVGPPHVRFSPGVDVVVGRPRRVGPQVPPPGNSC
ncbi:MAG TPA: DUF2071 domain-containing protein [Acidimicrobiales bacterium]|nr:DUF2071 domain-containing protein [Acidimicrobiales bacterium]